MKKNYLILSLLLSAAINVHGQVVNGNFEIVKPNFLPSNWGMNFVQEVSIDLETGETTTDNIMYTWCVPSMVYATTEAHTGQYAMEISNAFNTTDNVVIKGSATIFADATQDAPGWNPGVPVSANANIERLGFYYKFLPVNNEVARATMTLFDAEGEQIGQTSVDIHATGNQFNYVYSYIYHDYNVDPAYMYIDFDMAKAGSTPAFGSRLIIDNVITNSQSLDTIITEVAENGFRIYPTVTDNEINIVPASQAQGNINYKVFNTQGRLVMETNESAGSAYIYSMNVSDLSAGIYFLQIESNLEKVTQKFIRK